MKDPYQILNIPSTASDEEVKKAYRDLARKYHPDNYHDNPLADLAQEKMKEINEAYDTIQKMRGTGHGAGGGQQGSYSARQPGYGSYGGGYSGYGSAYAGDSRYREIRAAIRRGDLNTAEHLLSILSDHNGEWNFLKGVVCQRRGWLDEARRYYETACQLSPDNPEYIQALERLENSEAGYRPQGFEVFSTGNNMCARLACAYCLCNALSCGGMRVFYC